MIPDLPQNIDEEIIKQKTNSADLPLINRTVSVDDNLYQYLINHSVKEAELLTELRVETSLYHMARMQISPETAQLLSLLIKIHNPKKLLEIGVFTGYSTLSIALAMSPDATLLAIEKKQMWLDIADRYIAKADLNREGQSNRVVTQCGLAANILSKLVQDDAGTYDFVFIDADKSNQIAYYKSAKQLLRSGGCIVIDNTLWWGNVSKMEFTDKDTILVRELNQYVYCDKEVDVSMIPIGDGLTLIRKK